MDPRQVLGLAALWVKNLFHEIPHWLAAHRLGMTRIEMNISQGYVRARSTHWIRTLVFLAVDPLVNLGLGIWGVAPTLMALIFGQGFDLDPGAALRFGLGLYGLYVGSWDACSDWRAIGRTLAERLRLPHWAIGHSGGKEGKPVPPASDSVLLGNILQVVAGWSMVLARTPKRPPWERTTMGQVSPIRRPRDY